jgi:hypothetical protein
MKRLPALLFALFFVSIGISCRDNNGNTDISYSESAHSYSMKAHFPGNKMRNVENYMDARIGKESNMSFVNAQIDGTLSLDDHTIFYIEKSPGTLKIKLDKDKNSDESYQEIKSMCEGIKKVLTDK